jgi:multiple sugar transport system ATP-binding protein
MNLVKGELASRRFTAPGLSIPAPFGMGPVTMGQRPEDMAVVASGAGDLDAEVFAAEALGDSTLVTFRFGPELLAVKAEKDCPARLGDTVGIRFDPVSLHFFDPAGDRLAAGVEPLRRERRER